MVTVKDAKNASKKTSRITLLGRFLFIVFCLFVMALTVIYWAILCIGYKVIRKLKKIKHVRW